jgi:SH3-like domain-containing protein
MRMALGAALLISLVAVPAHAGGDPKMPPYWGSIRTGQARMRTGPGRNYPVSWLYQRNLLPVRVIEIYKSWRKIEDPDGERGWLLVNLLSDKRTAFVKSEPAALRAAPDRSSPVKWTAAPGVVGEVSRCGAGWCEFNVDGREGYVEIAEIWGVDPGEQVK